MIIIFSITLFLILLYLIYPLWLSFLSPKNVENEIEVDEIKQVSLILLSYNGKKYLQEKIDFLISELSHFEKSELIIIDDNSNNETIEFLKKFEKFENVKLILKTKQEGIPHSMNIGVENAKYDYIIFCDQRQNLSQNSIKNIVEPLKYKNIGAVSGCIYHIDNENRQSIRCHENFLKSKESKIGSLIGVYGPFYSIKKSCYSPIPNDIILDDLYLSLRILKTKQIELRTDCQIIDQDFSKLYDYDRTKRYLLGFIQILKDKTLFSDLKNKHKTMLIWHKYLRILIPIFLHLSYISSALMVFSGIEYVITFGILTFVGILSIFPIKFKHQKNLKNLLRMNIFYFVGLIDVSINHLITNKQSILKSEIEIKN